MADAALLIEELGVGAYLKREREERGISLREIADKIRVRTFYLEKIEAEEFHRLPAVPIGRGFVRAYASYIGVDEEEIVRRYNSSVGGSTEDIDNELGSKIVFSPSLSSRLSFGLAIPLAAIALFILISGTFLWFVRGKTEHIGKLGGFTDRIKAAAGPAIEDLKKINGDASPKNNAGAKVSPVAGSILPRPSGTDKPLKKDDKGNQKGRPATLLSLYSGEGRAGGDTGRVNGRLGLTIRALEDTWLRLKVDENDIVETLLTAGSEKTWRGSDKFVLTVGNVAGTKVSLNNMAIPLPQPRSNILREFVITDKMAGLRQASTGGRQQ